MFKCMKKMYEWSIMDSDLVYGRRRELELDYDCTTTTLADLTSYASMVELGCRELFVTRDQVFVLHESLLSEDVPDYDNKLFYYLSD